MLRLGLGFRVRVKAFAFIVVTHLSHYDFGLIMFVTTGEHSAVNSIKILITLIKVYIHIVSALERS